MALPSQEKRFWSLPHDIVIEELSTTAQGLTTEEANERLKLGENVIQKSSRTGKLKILFYQIKSPLILILIFAAVVTAVLGDYKDTVFILIAVFVNVSLGFYQENKAESALENLRTYIKDRTRVIRDGRDIEIDAKDVVVGDILKLAPGWRVAADARVIRANRLTLDEAILTGESLAVEKNALKVKEDAELAERTSMLFGGTMVVDGRGMAVVVATGSDTELGKIAALVSGDEEEKTPLQKAISDFAIKAGAGLLVLTSILFGIGVYTGKDLFEMFLTSVAIAVSAVPEGLPIALTVILAVGVERLARRKGVVKKLLAAEALGSTTLVLTDKTGTLTEARLQLSDVISDKPTETILEMAMVNTDVIIGNPSDKPENWQLSGTPVDVAIAKAGLQYNLLLPEVLGRNEILEIKPFNSRDKFSAVHAKMGSRSRWVYLGAPDVLVEMSDSSRTEKDKLLLQIDELAYAGSRILGVVVDKQFAGLIVFRDPVRHGVSAAMKEVGRAGVKTVIVTGDHKGTAMAVANELDMNVKIEEILTGKEMADMSDHILKERAPDVRIYARVSPEDKLRLVRLYKELGEVVAVTGDGVNDAPALKGADIGIAVGSGTDVAKGAADLIILDDNFETIVEAIREGRRILGNIKKVLVYLLSNVLDELILIGGALIMGLTLPLNALQILWVNFFSDSFPAVALAFEEGESSLSGKPSKKNKLFDNEVKFLIWGIGTITSFLLLFLYVYLLNLGFDPEIVRTFIFATFSVYTLFLVFSIRSLGQSIFTYNPFSNRYLVVGTFIGFALTGLAIYWAPLRGILGTVSLPLPWLWGVVGIGLVNILLVELGKFLFKGKNR